MSEARFDETIHAPVRLRICGLLRPVDHLDFAVLRDALNVSDATLSKHLKTLTAIGYVSSSKTASAGRGDARRITWLSLTRAGRSAFDAHVRALQQIAGSSA
ncbi:transcriptional regulator [Salinibacterium sp. ZJ450]|uniref:transcriptional regulator n=1 Tax=Salinibacterium sp. ZJ450 TaxID=2708338 RepID=UPI0014243ADB|nr:transcriptional regulator [Salinibacterium sp. ZJ450]